MVNSSEFFDFHLVFSWFFWWIIVAGSCVAGEYLFDLHVQCNIALIFCLKRSLSSAYTKGLTQELNMNIMSETK